MTNRTHINALATNVAWRIPEDVDNNSIINRADTDIHVKLYAVSAINRLII